MKIAMKIYCIALLALAACGGAPEEMSKTEKSVKGSLDVPPGSFLTASQWCLGGTTDPYLKVYAEIGLDGNYTGKLKVSLAKDSLNGYPVCFKVGDVFADGIAAGADNDHSFATTLYSGGYGKFHFNPARSGCSTPDNPNDAASVPVSSVFRDDQTSTSGRILATFSNGYSLIKC